MKILLKSALLIAIVAVAMIGVMVPSSFAQYMGNVGIEIQTESSHYNEGEDIVITGNIDGDIGNAVITGQIFHDGNVIDIIQIGISEDGDFKYVVIAEGPQWKNSGKYFFKLTYGDRVEEISFDYMSSSSFHSGIYPLLVSVSPDGEPGNNQSYDHSISANGEFVVFASNANNLVDDDQNFQTDVFVRDLLNEKTELVSISANGKQGGYPSSNPTISADGRYVVFNTRSNLDPDDLNENSDVYMRDRESNKTIWISKPQTDASSGYGDTGIISSDGKFIIFKSSSESLGLPNTTGNLFLWDNVRLTLSALPIHVQNFGISGDGEKIQFNDGDIVNDLFVYDRNTGSTTNISIPITEFHSRQSSSVGAMDFEGNMIVFRSEAPNLVENDDNNDTSFFLHDMRTSKTKLISIDPNNESFFANSHPDISDDGKFVLMHHRGSLVYDVETEKITKISPYGGSQGGISSNGELITFEATSSINNNGEPTPVSQYDVQIYVTTVNMISDSPPTVDEHSEQNEISSDNTSLTIDKIIYHPGELIKISGVVKDSQKGTQVKIILTNPDGTNTGLTIYPNSDGEYSTIIQINSEYELGEYSILSSYNSKILGKEIFSIQIKSQNNYDVPIVEPTPEPTPEPEPTLLGIASFVDQTKDPQSYVDRYNNEPTYKEWFDENYPQYSSIYEAIGMEKPAVEPVSEPVVKYVPEPTTDTSDTILNKQSELNASDKKIINNLKKLIPNWYNVDENSTGVRPDGLGLWVTATIQVEQGGSGRIVIINWNDENTMWDKFKYVKTQTKLAENVENSSATCFKGLFPNDLSGMICVQENLWIGIETNYGETKLVMNQVLSKISFEQKKHVPAEWSNELQFSQSTDLEKFVLDGYRYDYDGGNDIFFYNDVSNIEIHIYDDPNVVKGNLQIYVNNRDVQITKNMNFECAGPHYWNEQVIRGEWNGFYSMKCIQDNLEVYISGCCSFDEDTAGSIMKQMLIKIDGPLPKIENSKGGGCLIATATYGSEMATEVQQLRELRDNQLLQTESGTAFMETFNDIYYSFSPIIADYERENPLFKEVVKIAITPMISSLSLMENAESESEVLSIGISVIALNLGMYLGIPAVVIVGIRKRI